VCFDCLCNFCQKLFSFLGELSEILSQIYICHHVKYQIFLLDINEHWAIEIKLLTSGLVLVVNIYRYCICYTSGDVSYTAIDGDAVSVFA
jgi:hypothetical protein